MSQAFEEGIVPRSAEAGADLSTKQYYGVKINASGLAVLCAAAGEYCYGVLQNDPTSGKQATIAVLGITKAIAGGVINPGARVAVDANGKFVAASLAVVNTSDGGAASDPVIASNVVGIHRGKIATAANDIFPLDLLPMGAVPTTAA